MQLSHIELLTSGVKISKIKIKNTKNTRHRITIYFSLRHISRHDNKYVKTKDSAL